MDHLSNMKTKLPQMNADVHIQVGVRDGCGVNNDAVENFPRNRQILLVVFFLR